jgi:endonuclease/exonuclease/phosphatase (EEP) superfamily protein YafD
MSKRKRISPAWGIIGGLLAVAVLACGGLLIWPQAVGLQRTLPFTQLVSFRLVGLLCLAAALVLVLILLLVSRQARALFGATAIVLTALLVAGSGIYLVRGVATVVPASNADDAIRVLSWNTLGNEPGSPTIAQLAIEHEADVVMLPETTEEMGIEIAGLMSEQGRPMWVLSNTGAPGYAAAETTLLISADLGEYELNTELGDTSALATVIAEPVDGDGPRLIAAHPIAPTPSNMDKWRSDLEWLSTVCDGNTILAGDLNATLDHLWGLGTVDGAQLGECLDAAQQAGAASSGTWTSGRPTTLVPALDHVMATTQWEVTGFEVITSADRAGSDHRPVFAELTPAS